MTDIAKTVLGHGIDIASGAVDSVIDVLGHAADLATGTGTSALAVGDKSAHAVLHEAAALKEQLVTVLRSVADAAGKPLP